MLTCQQPYRHITLHDILYLSFELFYFFYQKDEDTYCLSFFMLRQIPNMNILHRLSAISLAYYNKKYYTSIILENNIHIYVY